MKKIRRTLKGGVGAVKVDKINWPHHYCWDHDVSNDHDMYTIHVLNDHDMHTMHVSNDHDMQLSK